MTWRLQWHTAFNWEVNIFPVSGCLKALSKGVSFFSADSAMSGIACVPAGWFGNTWSLRHFQFFLQHLFPCFLSPQESDNIGGPWSAHSPEKPVPSSGNNRGGSFELALLGGHQQNDCGGKSISPQMTFPKLRVILESGGCKDLQNDLVQISCCKLANLNPQKWDLLWSPGEVVSFNCQLGTA